MTTSLEISKALKEAGWKNEVEFYWYGDDLYFRNEMKDFCETCEARTPGMYITERKRFTAAPTAEEILEKLPPSIIVNGETLHLVIMDDRDWVGEASWDICYSKDRLFSWDIHVREKGKIGDGAFAGACAKMWILLKKLNLL